LRDPSTLTRGHANTHTVAVCPERAKRRLRIVNLFLGTIEALEETLNETVASFGANFSAEHANGSQERRRL
jgi:hypothetical protein